MPKVSKQRLRNFCFTINNYDTTDLKLPSSYLVIGKEIGESGTPHLQGYCELTKQTSFNVIKKLIPTAHIEPRRGTAEQAADYCKKDGNFIETGKISQPGKRNDLATLRACVMRGDSDKKLFAEVPCMYKYYRAARIHAHIINMSDNTFIKPEVIVLWGDAGVGKSRAAREIDPILYTVHNNAKWWCGYDQHETILFDDYYGTVPWSLFLQLLDGYRMQLPTKGGQIWKSWKRVIITSNIHPKEWYPEKGIPAELARRLTDIRHMVGDSTTPHL